MFLTVLILLLLWLPVWFRYFDDDTRGNTNTVRWVEMKSMGCTSGACMYRSPIISDRSALHGVRVLSASTSDEPTTKIKLKVYDLDTGVCTDICKRQLEIGAFNGDDDILPPSSLRRWSVHASSFIILLEVEDGEDIIETSLQFYVGVKPISTACASSTWWH